MMQGFRTLVLALVLTATLPMAVLAQGTVTGTITGNGQPLSDVEIRLCGITGANCTSCNSALTNTSGTFTFSDVPANPNYYLQSSPWKSHNNASNYISTYYPDTINPCDAETFSVISGHIVSRSIDLSEGGSISGTVLSSGTGKADVSINCSRESDFAYGYGYTDSNGIYETNPLPAGQYRCSIENQYYNNKTDWDSADLVSVTAGQVTTGIDFTFTPTPSSNKVVVVPLFSN